MYDLKDGFVMSFESMYEAAIYLINEGLTGCKVSTIRTHISEVCREKEKLLRVLNGKFQNNAGLAQRKSASLVMRGSGFRNSYPAPWVRINLEEF